MKFLKNYIVSSFRFQQENWQHKTQPDEQEQAKNISNMPLEQFWIPSLCEIWM